MILADIKCCILNVRRFECKCSDRHGLRSSVMQFLCATLSLDYCCPKREWKGSDDQSIYVSVCIFLVHLNRDGSRPKHSASLNEAPSYGILQSVRPPLLSLSLTSPLSPPFSHHNIVFISPLRLNPSLPVHCGKRHFENEIGYINSSAITLAIAFPLYSSSETWLTSTATPHISHKTQG